MLRCSTSLWSADLSRLADDLRRVEPFSERFHLDVADGHYTPTMLFFPDLVKQLRPLSSLEFEVHLMTTEPAAWIDPFCDAGADGFIYCFDSTRDLGGLLAETKRRGKRTGVSLLLTEPLDVLEPYWQDLDLVCIVGTAMGIKGASMDAGVPDKIRRARQIIGRRGLATEIEADGGIRRETVPLLAAAGADWLVPGSLMFKEDPAQMRRWLATLPGADR
jgi:ribulose-phosphate 3-epimerase